MSRLHAVPDEPEHFNPFSQREADPNEQERTPSKRSRKPGKIPPNLPKSFWEDSEALSHIQIAAFARRCSPDAVLGALLARLGAMAPPDLRCDAGQGPSPLTVFSALCGGSESGKSRAIAVARELLPELPEYDWPDYAKSASDIFHDDVPLGSGQGLVEAFYDSRFVKGDDGIRRKERRKFYDHVSVVADEGKSMTDKIKLPGSEHSATMRSAWSGEGIGQQNASGETTRIVRAGTYSIGLAVGFQPGTIGPLLAEYEVGTPQRFGYMSATCPGMPDKRPDFPGALPIAWPTGTIGFPKKVRDLIDTARLKSVRGEQATMDPFSKHLHQNRMRWAALFAVLDDRATNLKDWSRTSTYSQTSAGVRDFMAGYDMAQAAKDEAARRDTFVDRAAHAANANDTREGLIARAVGQAIRHIERTPGTNCADKGHTRRCFTNAIKSTLRAEMKESGVPMDAVVGRIMTSGKVRETDDGTYEA